MEEQVHATSAADWRAWLAEHHGTRRGVWFVSWKSHTGKPVIPTATPVLQWIVQARKAETRVNRVREAAEKAAQGERANRWTRPAP